MCVHRIKRLTYTETSIKSIKMSGPRETSFVHSVNKVNEDLATVVCNDSSALNVGRISLAKC